MSVKVAVCQLACTQDREANIKQAVAQVRMAASLGAQVILLPELISDQYICQAQDARYFAYAEDETHCKVLTVMEKLAKELRVVLPVSFFERANKAYFNSVVVIDADGKRLGKYRKSHIPDGPGYQEKFYFTPGDTGFKVWHTAYCCIGVGICWDQWFPECARAMCLQGAELLLYPTAIGSEPHDPTINSREHWMRTMQGHAAANLVPILASNRVGKEVITEAPLGQDVTFYGGSFITDETGKIVCQADLFKGGVWVHEFNLVAIQTRRAAWGLFRDRRPDLYASLLSHDGIHPVGPK